MSFDRRVVAHVARLARLPLVGEEEHRFARELESILAAFESLPEPESGEPSVVPPAALGVLRADEVTQSDAATRDAIVAAFPRRAHRFAKVPRGL